MTPEEKNNAIPELGQADFRQLIGEKMKTAVHAMFLAVLDAELTEWCGASRYERSSTRKDQRIGSRTRDLVTTVGKIEDLEIPRTRHGFQTQLFEKYHRRQAAVDEAIGEMFVRGISQARVGEVLETLNGEKPSASTVSRVHHNLQAEYDKWRQRSLPEHYAYAFADGSYFNVIYGSESQKMPILTVIGITPAGVREVIAFTTGEHENEAAWRDLMDDIKSRGVNKVDLWISDGGQAMINALTAKFPASKRQRCMRHKMENVLSHVPEKLQDEVEKDFKAIFYQENREQADQLAAVFRNRYENVYPEAVACMDRDWAACLTFYAFPKEHWVKIRTSNVIEMVLSQMTNSA
jgi:putative transposase